MSSSAKQDANFLAVDIGASSGRVLHAHWDGERFHLHPLHRFANQELRDDAHVYWNAQDLWQHICEGIRTYATTNDAPLNGIGIDTWGVDFALFDAHGTLLQNPYHYRDPHTDGVLERTLDDDLKQFIYERTGVQFLQINTLFQLITLQAANDPALTNASSLLMMPDLFNYWLCGKRATELSIASTSQLLNAHSRQWDNDIIQHFKLPANLLPDIKTPGTILGTITPDLQTTLGLKRDTPVISVASHDTASAVAAIPDLDANSIFISSGTWSLLGTEVTKPILTDAARHYNFTNEAGVNNTIRFLKNIAGMWFLQQAQKQWQQQQLEFSWEALLELASEAEAFKSILYPDAHVFLGHGDMLQLIHDYCVEHDEHPPETPGALVRCCLESLALRYRAAIENLTKITGQSFTTIRIVGGGSQNALLNQLTADACGCTVVAGPVEATALGNAMMQAVATGVIKDVAAGRQAIAKSCELQVFTPDVNADKRGWDAAYARFKQLEQRALAQA